MDSVIVFFIRQLSLFLQKQRHKTALAIGRFCGWVLSKIYYRRRIAYANLKAAFGGDFTAQQRKRIVEQHFLNIAQNVVEVLRFPKLTSDYVGKYISVSGRERYEEWARKNQGAILITPHFGNWELSQILSALVGKPFHVLARQQKHSKIDDYLNELRSSHGSTVIHKGGGVRDLIRALRQGGMIGVLGDLSGGRDGIKVKFFNRITTAPGGIFEIASRTDAAILPVFMVRLNNGPYHQVFIEEIFPLAKTKEGTVDVAASVRNYYQLLEQWIRKYPSQWFWMYKRWKHCFTKRILILKDDKAGHSNQASAIEEEFRQLGESLKDHEFRFESIQVQFRSQFRRKLFYLSAFFLSPFAQGRLSLLRFFLKPECARAIENAYADIIISAGSSLAPLNLLLKKENLAKSVAIMKPSFPYSAHQFDLLILPMHDRFHSKRVPTVRTLVTPNQVREKLLEQVAAKLSAQIPPKSNGRKRLSVFIGGSSKAYEFNLTQLKKWAARLKESAQAMNFEILITTSRRTGIDTAEILKHEFSENPLTKLLVIANESNIDQVAYGMLAHSDVAVVTEDSISMISEAVSAGKQVVVLQVGNGKLPKKHVRFHELLEQNKLIQLADASNFDAKLNSINGTAVSEIMRNQSAQIQEALRKLL